MSTILPRGRPLLIPQTCKDALNLAGSAGGWHHGGMIKNSVVRCKAVAPTAVIRKRKSAAQKFRELPEEERRNRLHAFIEEVDAFWKEKPDTGAVEFLIKLRRGN